MRSIVPKILSLVVCLLAASAAYAQVDALPPACTQTVLTGPPLEVQFEITDTGSGIAQINVLQSENADTVTPAFTPGTAGPVTVTSTKILPGLMIVVLQLRDVAGNTRTCSFAESAPAIPALDPSGLALLASLLAIGAIVAIRRLN